MSSNRETYVSDSSYESELVAMKYCCEKVYRLFLMLRELGFDKIPKPITLYCDNEAAVNTATEEHLVTTARTKMMNRNQFKVHESVERGHILPKWISGEECDADAGTKPLMGYKFHYISNRTFSRKPDEDVQEEVVDDNNVDDNNVDDNNVDDNSNGDSDIHSVDDEDD